MCGHLAVQLECGGDTPVNIRINKLLDELKADDWEPIFLLSNGIALCANNPGMARVCDIK